jgi:hypothetical protein
MPTVIDIASLNKDAPVIVFKKDESKKVKKPKELVIEEEVKKIEEKPKTIKKVKEKLIEKVEEFKEPIVEVKKVKEPVVEVKEEIKEKPKRVKLEKGSDLAKQWGLMMKEKRDAKKAIKIKEMNEPLPEFM